MLCHTITLLTNYTIVSKHDTKNPYWQDYKKSFPLLKAFFHKQPFWVDIHFSQRKNSLREAFLILIRIRNPTYRQAGMLKKASSLPERFL
jgi:hypothetical protein